MYRIITHIVHADQLYQGNVYRCFSPQSRANPSGPQPQSYEMLAWTIGV